MHADIALATYEGLPDLDVEEQPLIPALAERGVRAQPARWDDPEVDWKAFRLVLVRNVWDSHLRRDAFLAWASKVGQLTRLLNAPDVLRWNTHKGYLRELEAKGVPVTPTAWLEPGARVDLGALLAERGWAGRFVLKPVVSAGSHGVSAFGPGELGAAQAALDALLARGEAMVQPYLESFEREGERSYVFFGGHFSHAVRRPPGLADVPRAFAAFHPVAPAPEELQLARQTMTAAGRSLLYARVDVATGEDGRPRLQELECTEPRLFLRQDAGAPGRFADAVVRALG